MRLLVYEYLSSGALAGHPGAPSLHQEGLAMFEALVADLAAIPNVSLVAPLDSTLATRLPSTLQVVPVDGPNREREVLQHLLQEVDGAILIAPEFEGILEERTRWCEDAGVILLGSSSPAVRLAADKKELAKVWRQAGVPTPACLDQPIYPCVVKPRDGAGSQATFQVHSAEELARAKDQARKEGWHGPLIIQGFADGEAVSIAFLIGPGGVLALPAARQKLTEDGRFRYQGGEMPLPKELAERAAHLGWRAIRAVPGLRGYVGVDLVLGETDWAIEINPRLTTSYVGYRALARFNISQALLALFGLADRPATEIWSDMPVHYTADGQLLPDAAKPWIIS